MVRQRPEPYPDENGSILPIYGTSYSSDAHRGPLLGLLAHGVGVVIVVVLAVFWKLEWLYVLCFTVPLSLPQVWKYREIRNGRKLLEAYWADNRRRRQRGARW